MIIQIKPIQKKENEWQPHNNIYYSQDMVNNIIIDENLKNDMITKQAVSFNAQNQTFNNVIFNCNEFQDNFIFLIKTKEIQKNREWYFAYVVAKRWDTSQHVILDLEIDPITSNYDLFYSNKLYGQVYIERTNNYEVDINDIHSDICNSIENKQEIINDTNIKINKNIDTFINSINKNYNKNVSIYNGATPHGIEIIEKGNVYTELINNNNNLIAYNSTSIVKRDNLKFDNMISLLDIDTLLKEYSTAGQSKYSDNIWFFPNEAKAHSFFDNLKNANNITIESFKKFITNIDEIITNSNEKQKINNWATIPTIFEINENSNIASFEFDISKIFTNLNLKDHNFLHQNIYITVDKDLFQIPIDFTKLNANKKIYGVRIYENGFTFYFYYNKDEINPFYTLEIQLNNDLLDDAYLKWKRDLQLQYNTGLKTKENTTSILQSILPVLIAGGVSLLSGGSFSALAFGGLLLNSYINNSFNNYQQIKNEHYQSQKIIQEPPKQEITLSGVLLNKILFDTYKKIEWGYFDTKNLFTAITYKGYFIKDWNQLNLNKSKNFKILVKKPLDIDERKIKQDQYKHGNIVNLTIFDYENPLIINNLITSNVLYWKGKIQPSNPPIDSFSINHLNLKLSEGVFIKLV